MVGSDVNFYHPVAFQTIILGSWCSHNGIFWQNDDSVMACTNAYFVFCTNHSVRFNATQLALFDDKFLVAVIEFGAESGNNHFLACCNIWSSTYNLFHMIVTFIHCAYMHVVTIWMRFAGENLTNNKSFESTFDGLHFFNSVNFQAHTGKGICHFLCCHVEIDVFF